MEYRICDFCNHKNDTSFLECEKCGADISYIPPTKISERNEQKGNTPQKQQEQNETFVHSAPAKTIRIASLKLVSLKDGFTIELPIDGGIVGRSGTLSPYYFQDNLYVSNQHAEIKLNENGYVVIDQSTNGTKINGMKLEKGVEYPIKIGDQITFANITFTVNE